MKRVLFILLFPSVLMSQVQIDKRVELTGTGNDARVSGIDSVADVRDAVSAGVHQSGRLVYAASSGSNGNYSVNLIPAVATYSPGMTVNFRANHANPGAVTLNVNGLGPRSVKRQVTDSLRPNDILSGQIVQVIYDGTNFQLLSVPQSAVSGGANGSWGNVKRIFITSTTGTGNFATWAGSGGSGGIAGADNICNARARAASLPGTYLAMISTSTIHMKDRAAGIAGPIVNTRDYLVYYSGNEIYAPSYYTSVSGGVLRPIAYDEFGNTVSSDRVWTGTYYTGLLSTSPAGTCTDWTSTNGIGVEGCAAADACFWKYCADNACSFPDRHLVCLQQ